MSSRPGHEEARAVGANMQPSYGCLVRRWVCEGKRRMAISPSGRRRDGPGSSKAHATSRKRNRGLLLLEIPEPLANQVHAKKKGLRPNIHRRPIAWTAHCVYTAGARSPRDDLTWPVLLDSGERAPWVVDGASPVVRLGRSLFLSPFGRGGGEGGAGRRPVQVEPRSKGMARRAPVGEQGLQGSLRNFCSSTLRR